MQQSFEKFSMFRNRLEKVYRHLGRQARRQGISCFRFYDHDIPEFPFIIEQYEGAISVAEYQRRFGLSEDAHAVWLSECAAIIAEITTVDSREIYFRKRQRKAGRLGQYQKMNEEKNERIVKEGGLQFIVNMTDYLDTGLFLDHRITREMVRNEVQGKRVLNLFCYTGSFSVYAAAGGASEVVSVDLSKTYLDWGVRNIAVNNIEEGKMSWLHADVKQYLGTLEKNSFDLVIMDPPTFSNSKRMEDILDIQRDHVVLINQAMDALRENGVLYFSTNYTKFELDAGALHCSSIKDITKATTPFDFEGKLKRQCYRMEK